MKKNLLATAMLSMALTMGFGGKEGGIKKHKEIARNWKEDQAKDDKLSRLEKARLKRIRKSQIRYENSIKSQEGRKYV